MQLVEEGSVPRVRDRGEDLLRSIKLTKVPELVIAKADNSRQQIKHEESPANPGIFKKEPDKIIYPDKYCPSIQLRREIGIEFQGKFQKD